MTYQQELTQAINDLIDKLLNTKLTRREITKLVREFQEALKVPTIKFIEALKESTFNSIDEDVIVNALIKMNIAKNIARLTPNDIEKIVNYAYSNLMVFSRLDKNGKTILTTWSIEEAIKKLPVQVSQDIRRTILAGHINGDSNAQIVTQLIGSGHKKKLRRNIRTITETLRYQAQIEANMEVLKQNKGAYDFLEYVSIVDGRRDEICELKHGKRWDKVQDIKAEDMPQIHPNCRCDIVPKRL